MSVRTDWTRPEIAALFELPFTELLFRAATVHRANTMRPTRYNCAPCSA